MADLVIADTSIRRDGAGRYCLNDLHRASGGEAKHQPAFWLRNAQTRALIDELGNSANSQSSAVVTHEGATGGTFVAKELVYGYAMWISPAFHLRVIRAYDALVNMPAQPLVPQSLPEALRLAADLAEKVARSEAALALAAPKAQALDRIATPTEGAVCIRVASKLLQIPEREFIRELHARNWIFRHHHSGTWQGYSDKAKAGLLEMKLTRVERNDGTEKVVEQVLVTRRGLAKLALILQRPLLGAEPLSAA